MSNNNTELPRGHHHYETNDAVAKTHWTCRIKECQSENITEGIAEGIAERCYQCGAVHVIQFVAK
jgi:hypothetical protein